MPPLFFPLQSIIYRITIWELNGSVKKTNIKYLINFTLHLYNLQDLWPILDCCRSFLEYRWKIVTCYLVHRILGRLSWPFQTKIHLHIRPFLLTETQTSFYYYALDYADLNSLYIYSHTRTHTCHCLGLNKVYPFHAGGIILKHSWGTIQRFLCVRIMCVHVFTSSHPTSSSYRYIIHSMCATKVKIWNRSKCVQQSQLMMCDTDWASIFHHLLLLLLLCCVYITNQIRSFSSNMTRLLLIVRYNPQTFPRCPS